MSLALDPKALAQLFTDARSMNAWQDKAVSDDTVTALYDLMKMGPTSANCCPARLVFVKSEAEKARLAAAASEGNQAKILAAPVTVVIGYDQDFAAHLPFLFPHEPTAKDWFADEGVKQETAFRNGTLQAAYLMMAARSLGLDCGPMSGFDQQAVNKLYFSGTSVKSNFICSLGYGDRTALFDRSPRFDFETVCQIV